jgi:dipeptidyl aminopeptidase/acylaminoacyl peptidase
MEQSIVFVERCRAAGGTVEFVLYAGEGHGFRKPENQLDEYARMAAFLAKFLPGG